MKKRKLILIFLGIILIFLIAFFFYQEKAKQEMKEIESILTPVLKQVFPQAELTELTSSSLKYELKEEASKDKVWQLVDELDKAKFRVDRASKNKIETRELILTFTQSNKKTLLLVNKKKHPSPISSPF